MNKMFFLKKKFQETFGLSLQKSHIPFFTQKQITPWGRKELAHAHQLKGRRTRGWAGTRHEADLPWHWGLGPDSAPLTLENFHISGDSTWKLSSAPVESKRQSGHSYHLIIKVMSKHLNPLAMFFLEKHQWQKIEITYTGFVLGDTDWIQ